MLEEMREPLREIALSMEYAPEVPGFLAEKAMGGKFAARDLRSTIRREVEDKAASLLTSAPSAGKTLSLTLGDGEVLAVLV